MTYIGVEDFEDFGHIAQPYLCVTLYGHSIRFFSSPLTLDGRTLLSSPVVMTLFGHPIPYSALLPLYLHSSSTKPIICTLDWIASCMRLAALHASRFIKQLNAWSVNNGLWDVGRAMPW